MTKNMNWKKPVFNTYIQMQELGWNWKYNGLMELDKLHQGDRGLYFVTPPEIRIIFASVALCLMDQ